MSLSQSRRRRASVDFPAPEGDDKIIKRPRRLMCEVAKYPGPLFDILNLFAHLIYHSFQIKSYSRQVARLRL